MAIKLTSDSTCDLSPELIERHHIELFPLYITLGDKTYRDMVDIFPEDIFRHVEAGGDIATTAAVTPNDYATRFEALSREYEAVVHICIGSQFSACCQNAHLAAADFKNVHIIDSQNLSSGHGHVVMEAARKIESGARIEEVLAHLEAVIPKVDASFILNRLDYMRRGGRCSTITMLGANALQLKPCIEVRDGAMRVGTKYRGSFEKCIQRYVKDRLEERNALVLDRIFITHSHASPEAVEVAREAIAQYANFEEIIETQAGCSVSTHCGPSTLGVLFITK